MLDTTRLCHYAGDPAARPCCQLTALVRRGGVALCASCDARRSTLGKGQPATALPAGPPVDPLEWITTATARLRAAETELAAAAARARQHGHSWAAIGDRLGITRQAAQQRFGSPAQGSHGTGRPRDNNHPAAVGPELRRTTATQARQGGARTE